MSEYKSWKDLTPEELVGIAKFIDKYCYGHVQLNMNDTFGYACAWGVDADEFDLLSLIELEEKFGRDGVVAWAAIKEGVEKPIHENGKFNEAKTHILENMEKYNWLIRFRKEKDNK